MPHKKEQQELLDQWDKLAQSCMWFWPFENICVVSDRPKSISKNDQGRLHYLEGKAIEFRDGYGLWMINGVAVTEQIVMHPENITLDQINAKQNEEVKRIMIEQRGWDWYLQQISAVVLDVVVSDNFQEALMQAKDMVVLVCSCPSTGRVYSLEVDPSIRTVKEAQQWLSPFDAPLLARS